MEKLEPSEVEKLAKTTNDGMRVLGTIAVVGLGIGGALFTLACFVLAFWLRH